MFLAVDVGNTHIVLGLYREETLLRTWRFASMADRTDDEYELLLRQIPEAGGFRFEEVRGCMICSVIPRLTRTLKTALARLLQTAPDVLTHESNLGIENAYRDPKSVGADRLANAVGGVERYGAPLIAVDFGTATTFDVVSSDRKYIGGLIMPGLEMSAEALFQRTSLLPRIAIEPPRTVIGRCTHDAIDSGIVWGAVGAIDYLIERVRREMGVPDCPVIATGGHAATIEPLSEGVTELDPNLTLFGIFCIWKRNASAPTD